jgi:hypothetical protein
MKKMIIVFSIAAMFVLAGCGGPVNASTGTEGETVLGSNPSAVDGTALDEETLLMTGTMLLDGGGNAVDAEQAAALLTLWKAYDSISSSQTAAEAEISALFKQIQGEMSAAQLAEIEGMGLTDETIQTKLQELGIQFGGPEMMGTPDPEMQATMQALRDSGEMPEIPQGERPAGANGPAAGGQMPPGGQIQGGGEMPAGGPFAGEDVDPSQMATMQAQRGTLGFGQRQGGGFMLRALISYLEEKAGE